MPVAVALSNAPARVESRRRRPAGRPEEDRQTGDRPEDQNLPCDTRMPFVGVV